MRPAFTFLTFVAFAALAGCKPAADQSSPTTVGSSADSSSTTNESVPTLDDGHAHPQHGPHGGDLVELGQEDFHVELVHSDGGIGMYVLDGSATKQVPIASENLVISLKHEGQVESFELVPDPDANDTSGKSSRFTSSDPKLDQWLDAGAEGAVVIQIDGKSYTGKVTHTHDHHGHNH